MLNPTKAYIFFEPDREVIAQSEVAIAAVDGYPVSPGQALVQPRRHVATIWDLDLAEYSPAFLLEKSMQPMVAQRFAPNGFNLKVNCDEAAGEPVWHGHIHFRRRYAGNTLSPRGGVRYVIPQRDNY